MGRICKDIESRTANNGTVIANFPVAVDRDYQADGERQTDFIDVVAFKNTASFIERNFTKGKLIVVSGRLQSRKWEDKNGNNRVSWEVIAENVYFGGDKKNDSYQPSAVNVSASQFEELPNSDSYGFPF